MSLPLLLLSVRHEQVLKLTLFRSMYGVDTAHTRAHRATYLPKQQLDDPTLPGADQWTQGKGWQFEVADSGLKGMDKAQGDEGEKQ